MMNGWTVGSTAGGRFVLNYLPLEVVPEHVDYCTVDCEMSGGESLLMGVTQRVIPTGDELTASLW